MRRNLRPDRMEAAWWSGVHSCDKKVTIALVGKYVQLHDAYLSVAEALRARAAMKTALKCDIDWVDSEAGYRRKRCRRLLADVRRHSGAGRLWRPRALKGRSCRAAMRGSNDVPYLGICLGMQIAVIEFARNVLGLAATQTPANSTRRARPGDRSDAGPDRAIIPKAAPCGWARIPVKPRTGTMLARAYGCGGNSGAPPPPL